MFILIIRAFIIVTNDGGTVYMFLKQRMHIVHGGWRAGIGAQQPDAGFEDVDCHPTVNTMIVQFGVIKVSQDSA